MLSGRWGHWLALLAGLLAPLAFAPVGFWPLSLLSCLLLLLAMEHTSVRLAAFRGWLFGVGFYASGVSWVYVSIHQFGSAPPALAAFLTLLFVLAIALFFALHLGIYRWLVTTSSRLSYGAVLLGFPAVWVLAEWFRSWFLTGFPWLYLGYAPMDTWLGGWAPVTGVYGLSFWLALAASALYLLIKAPQGQRRWSLLLSLTLPLLLGWGLQQHQWTKAADVSPLRVTLLQGNTPQALKWQADYRPRIVANYLRQSLQHLDSTLIVWPETAVPQLLDLARPYLAPLEQRLKAGNIGLITGVPSRQNHDGVTHYYNSVAGLGAATGVYHKQRLVPFGEYVPLESWLRGLIAFFNLPMSNFSLGPPQQPPLRLDNGQTLAPFVCYEIVYPDLVADDSRGADYLLTVSNDSWFGDSLAPHQHLQMARMRALENGRYLLRATNNGISALVDPSGRVIQQSEQFVTAALSGEVQAQTGSTPFSRFGSMPMLLVCAAIAAALGLPAAKRSLASRR